MAKHLKVDFEPDRDASTRPTEDPRWQHAVLSKDRKRTRFLARQLRWRLSVEDFPIFVLNPSDPAFFDDLVDALDRRKYAKPARQVSKRAVVPKEPLPEIRNPAEDLDVVIGVAGPRTSEGMTVLVDQIFQLGPNQLAPDGPACFSQLADNHGLTDEDRAYNFLTARYLPPLNQGGEFQLSGMRVMPSRLGAEHGRILRAIYTFRNEKMTEKEYFVRVDVTNEFPMIASPWQQYVERGERS
jgi:hypothetical protein